MRYPVIFLVAAVLHLVWSATLTFASDGMRTTALAYFIDELGVVGSAWVFVVVGLAALGAFLRDRRDTVGLALIIPQQAALVISASTALSAVFGQHFPDGVVRQWAFILADQAPIVLIAAAHTFVVVDNWARLRV